LEKNGIYDGRLPEFKSKGEPVIFALGQSLFVKSSVISPPNQQVERRVFHGNRQL
jgi:hypothetical protein